MTRKQPETVLCQICNEQKKPSEVMPGELVRDSVVQTIRRKYPEWSSPGFICLADLNHFRAEYVQHVLEAEKDELSTLEAEVVRSLKEHELLSRNVNVEFDRELAFGERLADKVAEFGGSWRFIISFAVILGVWIASNAVVLLWRPCAGG